MRPNRVKVNPEKLVPTNSWGVPDYYEDQTFTCRGCKEKFVFTANEQRVWYEQFKIPIHAGRVRCPDCQDDYKDDVSLKQHFDEATEQLKSHPDHWAINLEFGRLALLLHASSGGGSLDRAIAALKRAHELNSKAYEAVYWLGRCYELTGNVKRQKECLLEFQKATDSRKKGELKRLRKDAEKRLLNIAGA